MIPTFEACCTMTVNELVLQHPTTLKIFQSHGIDTCCGGDRLVPEAARSHGIEPALLHAELVEWIARDGAAIGELGRPACGPCSSAHGGE